MQRRLATDGDDGRRQRRLLHARDGQADRRPDAGRRSSSARRTASARAPGSRPTATLDVRRVAFAGTWRATVGRVRSARSTPLRPRTGSRSTRRRTARATPAAPGQRRRDPVPVPRRDAERRPRRARRRGAGRRRRGRDPAGRRRARRARHRGAGARGGGRRRRAPMTVTLVFMPDWPDVVAAIGGGPQIVRDGAPSSARARCSRRTSSARARRAAPSASSRDGRIVLVAVDGRQPGYSVGLTNFELAQALVRLGAVTGMALDSGGSTTMAFDGDAAQPPLGRGRAAHLDRARCSCTTGSSRPSRPPRRLAERRRRRRHAEPRATRSCGPRR